MIKKIMNIIYYRTTNMRHIILSPKYSGVSTKYGKFHASREKLYIQLNSHMVPKASPLHASEFNSYQFSDFNLVYFQHVFSMAISALIESGIYQKIEKDNKAMKAYQKYFDLFWTREKLRSKKPLKIDHVMPAFGLLAIGLITSTTIFILELASYFYKKMPFGHLSQIKFSEESIKYLNNGKEQRSQFRYLGYLYGYI